MKKAIFNVLCPALVAIIAYGIGATEGENVKEKTIAFGLKKYSKIKELVGKVLPKEEATVEDPAPSEEV